MDNPNRLYISFPSYCLSQLKLLPLKAASFTVLAVGLIVAGCATTHLKPLHENAQRADLESDEIAVWRTADELEQELSKSSIDFRGKEEIEQYIERIMMRLAPDYYEDSEKKIRITVLLDTEPNAFILPNGALYVKTGLLSLMENEAHLATILGHEFSHFKYRHAIREKRKAENNEKIGTFVGILLAVSAGAVTGTVNPNIPTSMGNLWSIIAESGYSRDLEREADYEGLRMTLEAGYLPEATTDVFKFLLDATDNKDDGGFFASHPKLQERISNYREYLKLPEIQLLGTGTRIESETYEQITLPIYLANAEHCLKLERYDESKAYIEKYLNVRSDDAEAYLLLGDLTRIHRQNESNSLKIALDSYQKALNLDPECVKCYREIGLAFKYLGDAEKASEYLSKYLKHNPQIPDAGIIRSYIQPE